MAQYRTITIQIKLRFKVQNDLNVVNIFRFVNRSNLIRIFGLLTEFYTMVTGSGSRYYPFGIRSLFEVSPDSFCSNQVIHGLEQTQFKLVYIFNFLAKELQLKDVAKVNSILRQWRQSQVTKVKKICKYPQGQDQETSVLAKFIVSEC